jgi:hypothetical protein
MTEQGFGLEAEEFWSDPFRTDLQLSRRLRRQGFSGVQIDAPAFVAIDRRQSLPVVACRFGMYKDVWDVPYEQHALITAVDLDDNFVHAARAFNSEYEPLPRPSADRREPPEGFSSKLYLLELRELFGLSWHPDGYLVTAILRERVSNRVEVRLDRSPSAYRDEEVERFLEAKRAELEPEVHPEPGRPIPSYEPGEGVPPVPEEPGIRLAADRVTALTKEARCILRGSYRLTVLPQEIVKRPRSSNGGSRPRVTAAPAITLLVTGTDGAMPALLRLNVPSSDPVEPGVEAPVVTGSFTIDLLQLRGMPRRPQTYLIYAFSGRILEGPLSIALVAPQRLPRTPGGR